MAKSAVNANRTTGRNPVATPAAVPTPADQAEGPAQFPRAYYRKVKPSQKYPNGYEVRRVENEAEAAKIGKDWKESPEGMTPDYPFGHQD